MELRTKFVILHQQLKIDTFISACNAVVLGGEGVVTLSNYGLAHNCSLLMLFPQRVSVNFNYETKGATLPTKVEKEEINVFTTHSNQEFIFGFFHVTAVLQPRPS